MSVMTMENMLLLQRGLNLKIKSRKLASVTNMRNLYICDDNGKYVVRNTERRQAASLTELNLESICKIGVCDKYEVLIYL